MVIVLSRRNVEGNLSGSGLLLVRTSARPRDRAIVSVAPADLDDVSTVARFAHVAIAAGYYAEAVAGDRGKLERFAELMGVGIVYLPDVASREHDVDAA